MNGADRGYIDKKISEFQQNCVVHGKEIDAHFSNVEKNIITEIKNIKIEMLEELGKRDKQIVRLEVKSGLWGLIGGILTVLITIGVYYIKHKAF